MPRPRGFIQNYNPTAERQELIENVQTVLFDNHDILPLTIRQIFYMLVSGYGFPKDEKAYKRLTETIGLGRRAQLIDMSAIRDDGFTEEGGGGWGSAGDLVDTYKYSARNFRLDRQMDQPVHLMLWCEAKGMVPQLVDAVEEYSVTVYSSGGFDSLTSKHKMAQEISDYTSVEILHIGDHDPSGVHLANSLHEDLLAFCDYYGGDLELTRLAVTPEQVEELNLPTAPPKAADKRSFRGLTTQAEAIPPRTLRQIVQDAVTDRIDHEIYDELLEREAEERRRIIKKLEDL